MSLSKERNRSLQTLSTWHCICNGLAGMTWYMVWSAGHGMVYGTAWSTWQDIWYGLAGMAWYMVLPGEVWDGVCVCVFRFNIAFNNFSVISRRFLVATGSLMLTFIVLPH